MFSDAIKRAEHLDHHLDMHKVPLGPLHGVPISLKDTFKISGQDSSLGIAALAFNPSRSTSPLVSILINAGAVIYCKTNVPQTLVITADQAHVVFCNTDTSIDGIGQRE